MTTSYVYVGMPAREALSAGVSAGVAMGGGVSVAMLDGAVVAEDVGAGVAVSVGVAAGLAQGSDVQERTMAAINAAQRPSEKMRPGRSRRREAKEIRFGRETCIVCVPLVGR